jgi:hypothetical protein
MAKKMTKKEMFAQLIANYNLTAEEKEFVMHEIELLEKRNSKGGDRKPTAKQTENECLKTAILEFFTEHIGEKFTVGEIWKKVPVLAENPEMTNQRVSALIKALKDENYLGREEIKRKAYFYLIKVD